MNLIFLHYFGGGPRSWDGVISHLDDYPVQTPDLRKVGRWPGGYSVKEAATDVSQIVGEQDEPFVLVGHSMGGKIALAMAARQPQNLRGCVLIAPSPPSPEPMSDEDRASLLEGHGTREAAERIVSGAAATELPPDVWETAIAANLAYSERDWRNWIEIGTREDMSDQISAIEAPSLVIAGERDENLSASVLRSSVVALLPRSQLIEVEGVGHLVPQGRPRETAQLIRDWLEALPTIEAR